MIEQRYQLDIGLVADVVYNIMVHVHQHKKRKKKKKKISQPIHSKNSLFSSPLAFSPSLSYNLKSHSLPLVPTRDASPPHRSGSLNGPPSP